MIYRLALAAFGLYYAVAIYADFQLGLALLCQDLGVWG